jgi:hypothetical protein
MGELDPGRYRVRVTIFDRNGSQRVERALEFRVLRPADLAELYRWDELEPPRR